MTLHSLPLFVRLAGRPVILLGDGAAADAKRRLLERAGAVIVGGNAVAALAIIAIDDEAEAVAAVERLKARGILVNAVDRPALCDFTVPAIVDRAPVLLAIGTGGVSAGLAAALRQRIEALLPARLGALAEALHASRGAIRARFPDGGDRRRAIGAALSPGGALDPLVDQGDRDIMLSLTSPPTARIIKIGVRSADPEDLTLREARLLALADRLYHAPDVPDIILDRARADADRIIGVAPPIPLPGLSVELEMMA
ncbi:MULTISPECIES: bifunctional precorrin-2 dehydrogenase/sirohydrochlorin ferrochelatase [unclassified Sphingomonas]|uniref:precorrin-2 dehydrogenase/sirohydrochlorin ferrochelatase family protein n=1 Tax=unclassified Sphingomonas TaxID=196159 RepID=UPI000BDC5759|nr:MAG: siroheme synthase [Sphingomonas sp. 32-62-10]